MPTVSVQTHTHPNGWIMVPISVCGVWHGEFLLNTFTPVSSVSPTTTTMLEAFRCLGSHADQRHRLQGLIVGDVRLPDLPVRVSRAAALLDIEGMLGLNFLRQFTTVRFDVPSGTLTLELP
jgi:hypothetical protein